MPTFNVTVSDALLAKLQAVVNAYNANTGTTLTVRDWILLHLKDIAINDELSAAYPGLQDAATRDAQATLEAAAAAERERLLAQL